ncbi:MAG TPA: NUDIX domain-containing protein [Pseudonocardia sp.]|uniref:(deoxy)nucleoside triphosphate pyrophosphohydrolase n=1 Tax=Pseudonocardia sp. TaxID=60912 RepID=UPI002ED92BEC
MVVGAAIVRDGRLLAQRRAVPARLAGRWELPGGRVELGESEPAALRRECQEELGARITVLGRVGVDVPLPGSVLRVYSATMTEGSPEPRALEHAGLRWVSGAELTELDWLDADRVLLPDLATLLG